MHSEEGCCASVRAKNAFMSLRPPSFALNGAAGSFTTTVGGMEPAPEPSKTTMGLLDELASIQLQTSGANSDAHTHTHTHADEAAEGGIVSASGMALAQMEMERERRRQAEDQVAMLRSGTMMDPHAHSGMGGGVGGGAFGPNGEPLAVNPFDHLAEEHMRNMQKLNDRNKRLASLADGKSKGKTKGRIQSRRANLRKKHVKRAGEDHHDKLALKLESKDRRKKHIAKLRNLY